MPDKELGTFDPYAEWLGIPPAEQPPDYYRLLGLARFETDTAKIAAAADARMNLLRNVQTGPRGLIAQQVMNEVAAARVCLLSSERKSKYDQELWQRLADSARQRPAIAVASTTVPAQPTTFSTVSSAMQPPEGGVFLNPASPPPTISVASPSSTIRLRRRRQGGIWLWVVATALAVGGLATLAYVLSHQLP